MKGRESFGLKAKLAAGTGMGGRREVDERRGGRGGGGARGGSSPEGVCPLTGASGLDQ